MPILKKSITKALLSTFRALFGLLQAGTAERLVKTWKSAEQLQLLAVKSHFQLKFCALPLFGNGRRDHCCWWKLTCVNVLIHSRGVLYVSSMLHVDPIVDCGVQWGFARCCLTDKCTTWCHTVCCMSRWTIGWTSRKYAVLVVWQKIFSSRLHCNDCA